MCSVRPDRLVSVFSLFCTRMCQACTGQASTRIRPGGAWYPFFFVAYKLSLKLWGRKARYKNERGRNLFSTSASKCLCELLNGTILVRVLHGVPLILSHAVSIIGRESCASGYDGKRFKDVIMRLIVACQEIYITPYSEEEIKSFTDPGQAPEKASFTSGEASYPG